MLAACPPRWPHPKTVPVWSGPQTRIRAAGREPLAAEYERRFASWVVQAQAPLTSRR